MQLQLHYITQHYSTLHEYIALRYNYNCSCNYNCNYHYVALHDTTLITPHYDYNCATLRYTTLITPHHNYNCNYTTHYNYNSTTPHYNYNYNCIQLHYTTLHPAVVGEVTTATIATTPKTQLQPPFGPSVGSLCHPWFTTTNLSYWFPIFETSATALCGTTGKHIINLIQCERTAPDAIQALKICINNAWAQVEVGWRLKGLKWLNKHWVDVDVHESILHHQHLTLCCVNGALQHLHPLNPPSHPWNSLELSGTSSIPWGVVRAHLTQFPV